MAKSLLFMTTNYTDDLNDTTMAWKQIKKSSTAAGDNTGTDIGVNGLLTTSSAEGKITVSGLSAGYYCFVEQGVGNNKAFITDQTPHYFEVKGTDQPGNCCCKRWDSDEKSRLYSGCKISS